MITIHANESDASRRRVYFHLVDATDGMTPETGEASGQPQVSVNGGAWTNTGIGTLTAIGNGRYYAELSQTLIATAGLLVETRYKSANTAECPGSSVQVVGYDPHDADGLGMTYLDAPVSEVPTDVWDSATADHDDAGSMGEALAAAGSAGDPWITNLPGSYTTGQAGYIIGNMLDTSVGSRSNHSAADAASAVWAAATRTLTAFSFLSASGIAEAVWDEDLTTHTTDDTAGKILTTAGGGGVDPSELAAAVWDHLTEDIIVTGSVGAFVLAKGSLITSEGIVTASIVSTGEVIPIWQGRSRTITFVIAQAAIDLSGHTAKFGMTKITADTGTSALEVIGTLTEVGSDYHLTFQLTTVQTAALAKSPAPAHPYRITTSESYSYTWSISATDGAGSCPQLAEGVVTVKGSDTTCSTS